MRLRKLEVFSKDEIEEIHNASIHILENIGIKVEDPELRKLLEKNGAISTNTTYMKFPESLVIEKLKTVPDSFTLHGRDGDFTATIDTKHTEFATIGTPVRIYDPKHKKGVRKSVLADTIHQIRIVDSLKNFSLLHN